MASISNISLTSQQDLVKNNYFVGKFFACIPIVGVASTIIYEFSLLRAGYEEVSNFKRRVEILKNQNQYMICSIARDVLSVAAIEIFGNSAEFTPSIKISLFTLSAVTNLFRIKGIFLNKEEMELLEKKFKNE